MEGILSQSWPIFHFSEKISEKISQKKSMKFFLLQFFLISIVPNSWLFQDIIQTFFLSFSLNLATPYVLPKTRHSEQENPVLVRLTHMWLLYLTHCFHCHWFYECLIWITPFWNIMLGISYRPPPHPTTHSLRCQF